jgi:LytS/YehU family sensor histidine kinase
MKIEILRFPNRFNFNLSVDEELLSEEYTIPPHLIQPVLENAIKHAFKGITDRAEHIDLSIKLSEDKHFIITTVEDNGLGIDHIKSEQVHNSKGLSIVQNQLEILNKSSEFVSSIEIFDKKKIDSKAFGTKVILKIATDIE